MLSDAQVREWHERGWTTARIDVTHVVADVRRLIPESDADTEFGSPSGVGEFPTGVPTIDDMVARADIVGAVRQLLDTDDVRLMQADVWGKKGGIDQRMHQDYGNNTFLLPSWKAPDAVAVIIYYDSDAGGETHVVSRRGDDDPAYRDGPARVAPGYHLPFINDRNDAEAMVLRRDPVLAETRRELYARERPVPYTQGTVLFYRHDLWHRGTPTRRTRRVHSLGYVRAGAPGWTTWNAGFARRMYSGHVEDLVRRWTPDQLTLLGIPKRRADQVHLRYRCPRASL